MAVYDGFFDAVLDEETQEYDRSYGSENFTDYFTHIIGSGVCIHNAPDSFKVRFEGGNAVVAPGYLFIQGYWLKNDSDYTISVAGTATLAIVAHLNLGKRIIELEARSVAQAYPDSLVLALVNPAAGTAEDTRHNTDICGIIDTAGELSQKVEWAVNYIDNEIEDKLAAAEADIAEQSKMLDAKIAEVQAQVNKITPPAVGTIQFSASQDMGDDWLLCNGDFISESQYPDLVAALGKLIPSGDKFELISDGEISPQISNGVVYNGRMWVYSYSTKKLYGVDVEGNQPVKEVALTSDSEYFGNFSAPSTAYPICLSIINRKSGEGAKLFLAQIIGGTIRKESNNYDWMKSFLLFSSDFTGDEQSLEMSPPFPSITFPGSFSDYAGSAGEQCLPYVISKMESGVEVYYLAAIQSYGAIYFVTFDFSENATFSGGVSISNSSTVKYASKQRLAFSGKNNEEIVSASFFKDVSDYFKYDVESQMTNIFNFSSDSTKKVYAAERETFGPLNVTGLNKFLTAFDLHGLLWLSTADSRIQYVDPDIPLPSAARVFVDAAAYLWDKDIYLIFVGTGIIFSRTLEEGSFGYLDTTSVLGTITQFGYLDYSQDEGTLYLLGQDTNNKVKVAKIVLNTLYDYANDGAWLPMIAADGVPAYIRAKGDTSPSGGTQISVTVLQSPDNNFDEQYFVLFNDEALISGKTYTRTVQGDSFTVGLRKKSGGGDGGSLYVDGGLITQIDYNQPGGFASSNALKLEDYPNGIELQGKLYR